MEDTNAPIDEAVLQTLAGTLRTDDRISSVVLVSGKDADEHKHLAVTLDPTRYPEHIEQTRIELQWYRNDDFNAHYLESYAMGDVWHCRWDRHSNSHNTSEHFHPPPNAGTPTDTHFPEDYRDVLSMILVVIRVEELWQE
jgi:hypothetical protein